MRKNVKKAFACAVAIAMIFGSTIIPMSAKAEAISEEITEEEYDQNPDDYIAMDVYDVSSGETETYYMKDYPDEIPTISQNKKNPIQNKVNTRKTRSGGPLRSIIGTDDRTVVDNTKRVPYKYIGKLEMKFSGSSVTRHNYNATAFLVGKSIALTSAHCVYELNATGTFGNIYPSLSSDNAPDKNSIKYSIKKIHVPQQYKTAVKNGDDKNQRKYDYALIELNNNPGSKFGYFSLGGYNTMYTLDNIMNEQIVLVGYPENKGGKMYRQKGLLSGYTSGGYEFLYSMDTSDGQDGCPIIYPVGGGGYYVVGINYQHGGDCNYARYITKNIYDLVNKYK